jgi:hypothetical protein
MKNVVVDQFRDRGTMLQLGVQGIFELRLLQFLGMLLQCRRDLRIFNIDCTIKKN